MDKIYLDSLPNQTTQNFRPKTKSATLPNERKYIALTRQDFNNDILKNWGEIKALNRPSRRTNQIAFTFNDFLYIYGGRDINQGKMDDMYKLPLQLTTSNPKWEKVSFKGISPGQITNHKAELINNNLYVFGGVNPSETSSNSLYIYSISNSLWKQINNNITDITPLSGHSMSQINNKYICIFGGSNKGNFYNDLYIYTINEGTWTKEGDDSVNKPDKRIEHSQCSYNNSIYIYGGINQVGDYYNDLWKFDMSSYQWMKIEIENEVPKGRKGHSMILYKDTFLIFGGKTGLLLEQNQFWKYDIKKQRFFLIHDTMLDRYVKDEDAKKNELTAYNSKDKKFLDKTNTKGFFSKTKNDFYNRMNRTTGFRNQVNTLGKKNPFEDIALKNPNTFTMNKSLIFRMEQEDQMFLKQLMMINKENSENTQMNEVIQYGSIPAPRDGHSAFIYEGSMYIFGGDRNKFPYNDLFMFRLK